METQVFPSMPQFFRKLKLLIYWGGAQKHFHTLERHEHKHIPKQTLQQHLTKIIFFHSAQPWNNTFPISTHINLLYVQQQLHPALYIIQICTILKIFLLPIRSPMNFLQCLCFKMLHFLCSNSRTIPHIFSLSQ